MSGDWGTAANEPQPTQRRAGEAPTSREETVPTQHSSARSHTLTRPSAAPTATRLRVASQARLPHLRAKRALRRTPTTVKQGPRAKEDCSQSAGSAAARRAA